MVCVAYADGEGTSDEKTKVMAFLRSNEMLPVFEADKAVTLSNGYMGKFELDISLGEAECLASVAKLKGKDAEAGLLVRVCCAIGEADGNFDDNEKRVVKKVCRELGLNPTDFDLT